MSMNSCPFCGAGEDERPVDGKRMSPVRRGHFIVCRSCGARGPVTYWQGREPFTTRALRADARADKAEAELEGLRCQAADEHKRLLDENVSLKWDRDQWEAKAERYRGALAMIVASVASGERLDPIVFPSLVLDRFGIELAELKEPKP